MGTGVLSAFAFGNVENVLTHMGEGIGRWETHLFGFPRHGCLASDVDVAGRCGVCVGVGGAVSARM